MAGSGNGIKSIVMPLVVVNIIMFILQMVLGDAFTGLLVLHKGDLLAQPWTLLTSMFLHGSPTHLFFNMFALLMFGPLLEQKIGVKRFAYIYFLSGLIAAVISSFIYDAALGASGAIMGIIGVVIMLLPHLRVLFFFIIPMPLWVAGIVIAAIDIFGAIGLGIGGIANFAHLAGMATGLLYGMMLKGERRHHQKKFEKNEHLGDEEIEEYLKSGRI